MDATTPTPPTARIAPTELTGLPELRELPGLPHGVEEEARAVAALRERVGVPGLVDIHTHFMPQQVLDKVWAFFARGGHGTHAGGLDWPIHYAHTEEERVAILRAFGVRRFPSLSYAHKPGMARWLNEWSAGFAARTPDCAHSATFHPEPGATAYVKQALAAGARVFKVHLQVGAFDPRDPLLDDVWGLLAEAAVPVVAHVGSGPDPGPFTGPGPIGEVLARHPTLTLVVAHLGMPEYAAFARLAAGHPRVHLDTTMAFTDFTEAFMPAPPGYAARLADLGDRVVLGTDLPNIPYPYVHQLEALERLDLGTEWLRAVLWENGARLLGLDPRDAGPGESGAGDTPR